MDEFLKKKMLQFCYKSHNGNLRTMHEFHSTVKDTTACIYVGESLQHHQGSNCVYVCVRITVAL